MPILDREEYIEQSHLFRVMVSRLEEKEPTQDALANLREEILPTTKLPMAIDFLLGELRHAGELSKGMVQLKHYFTPFQTFLVQRAEEDRGRFDIRAAFLILSREAEYRSQTPTPAGLFIFQLECLARNRLGYDLGVQAISEDPLYPQDWKTWISETRVSLGAVDLCDLVYFRSDYFIEDKRRHFAEYQSKSPILFGRAEGRIAKAHRGKDPLFFFSALQRQLGYPAVPRPQNHSDAKKLPAELETRLQRLEKRLQLIESEASGKLDLSQFYAKPPDFKSLDSPEIDRS